MQLSCPDRTARPANTHLTCRGVHLIYPCHEAKKLLEPAYRHLSNCMEQRHLLLEVSIEDGQCIAAFPNGKFAFPAELHEKLAPLIGQTAAILRLDGQYYCRAVQ